MSQVTIMMGMYFVVSYWFWFVGMFVLVQMVPDAVLSAISVYSHKVIYPYII